MPPFADSRFPFAIMISYPLIHPQAERLVKKIQNNIVSFNDELSYIDFIGIEQKLKTAKLPYNGAYPKDQSNIMDIIFKSKKDNVKRVFLGIDELNYSGDVNETKFPITGYLYDDNILNDVSYIFNKDVMLDYCIKPIFDRSDSTQWNMIYPFWWQDEHYQNAFLIEVDENHHSKDEKRNLTKVGYNLLAAQLMN